MPKNQTHTYTSVTGECVMTFDKEGRTTVFTGYAGDAVVNGNSNGIDLFGFGTGNITFFANGGDNRAFGAGGNDFFKGGSNGTNHFDGGAGDDVEIAGGWQSTLNGGAGSDTLIGNGEYSELNGDAGNDHLLLAGLYTNASGGEGADRFSIAPTPWGWVGNSSIQDFNPKEGDILDLSMLKGVTQNNLSVHGDTLEVHIPYGGTVSVYGVVHEIVLMGVANAIQNGNLVLPWGFDAKG